MKIPIPHKKEFRALLIILSLTAILLPLVQTGLQVALLYKQNKQLESELTVAQIALSSTQRRVYALQNNLDSTSQNLAIEKENNTNFQNQIETITGTVGVLEKLSKTDTELLKKYSKIYFLNENYVPEKLTYIVPVYLLEKTRQMQIHGDVWPYLQNMMENASSSGNVLLIASAYRSFSEQAQLKSQYKVTYGTGANKFSADQGYSEHQLGTTVDLTTPKNGAVLAGFDKTSSYKWLVDNAYKYGFVMSYPKENTYYIFEPWHFRFVGIALATKIHETNTYFYALDQRDINQFLVNIFDK